ALDIERVLLVFGRCPATHGRVEFAGAILDGGDASRYRRAVDVDVEDGEKHADAAARLRVPRFFHDFHDAPVGRGNDRLRVRRRLPFRVANTEHHKRTDG